MKTIILYLRRNTGLLALFYFTRRWDETMVRFKIVTDDQDILYWCNKWGLEVVELGDIIDYDWLFCVHGNRILPIEQIRPNRCINFHPCLFKYKGHNPIKRYILNEDEWGTVESQYLIEEVDCGEVIHKENFYTGKVKDFASFYNIALPYYYKCFDKTLEKLGL